MATSTIFNYSSITVPILNGSSCEDYKHWSVKMKTIFVSLELWEIVEEGCEKEVLAVKSSQVLQREKMIRDSTFAPLGLWEIEEHGDETDLVVLSSPAQKVLNREKKKKDAMALHLIHRGVSQSVFGYIVNATSSKIAWGILKNQFEPKVSFLESS